MRIRREERGATLVWLAGSLVVLMGFAALAVDLGWYYLNSSRIQRAADAAALAGVVHVPGYLSEAETNARAAALVNGFPTEGGSATTSFSGTVLDDNQYQVSLASDVDLFLAPLIGIQTMDIAATATAEYVKPVPMGSPDNCFGERPGPAASVCTGTDPNFWAAVSGPLTNKWNGDAFSTRYWDDDSSWNREYSNSEYRPDGYYYAVEVFSGSSNLRVYVYDGGFYERSSFDDETGDRPQDERGGTDTNFQLYRPDATPLDPTDNPPISGCGGTIDAEENPSSFKNRWAQLCRINGAVTPGIYVLRVWATGDLGGTNQYSLAALTDGPNPRLYGINDISIFTNQGSSTARLKLAEVDDIHAGKILELRFYDPGEDDQPAYMRVKRPDGSTATCSWYAEDELGNQTRSGSGSCNIQTSDGSPLFQGQWVTAAVEIPDSYSCTSNCWWEMEIQLSQPHDRTTWQARVIGNPVRLVPNP